MQAHEIMVKHVYKVIENEPVSSVIEKFISHRIGSLPVVNDRNEVIAYVSDGDIMRYIGKHEDIVVGTIYFASYFKGDDERFEERIKKLLSLNVMAIANKKVHTVPWDEEVEKIASILGKVQIKKLPVIRNGVLVGIISRGDIIRHSFQSLL